ncbi:hypothetical protein HYDPIDRAFT_105065, partial [Hydnomerulius pinastri MD-312]
MNDSHPISFGIPDTTVHNVITRLQKTSARFLVSSSPIKSSSRLPTLPLMPISPIKHVRRKSLASSSNPAFKSSSKARELDAKVKMLTEQVTTLKRQVTALQATVVLQAQYCDRVRRHLETHEKKNSQDGSNVKLHSDGMPRLLTSDEMFNEVVRYQEQQETKAVEQQAKKAAKEARSRKMEIWLREEEARKERNKAKTEEWKAASAEWEAERDLAKKEKRKPHWKKPARGPLEKARPKPADPTRKRRNCERGNGNDQEEFIDVLEGSEGDDSEYDDEN